MKYSIEPAKVLCSTSVPPPDTFSDFIANLVIGTFSIGIVLVVLLIIVLLVSDHFCTTKDK